MRRNPDEDLRSLERSAATGDEAAGLRYLRALERVAAAGDEAAAVRLDVERWRRDEASVLGEIVERDLQRDVAHSPDYFPAAGPLAARVQGPQEEAIDAIGRAVLGDGDFYAWRPGEDGWQYGTRTAPDGATETRLDGPNARYVSPRDNRNRERFMARKERLARALEEAGYKVFWVERSGERQDVFVPLDERRIRIAAGLVDVYREIIEAERNRQAAYAREFEEIETARDVGEITPDEAERRQRARVDAERLTPRERWIMRGLHRDLPGGSHPNVPWSVAAMWIARRMRRVEKDPYAYEPSDNMEEIAEILGADRGTDALDGPDGEPAYLYVAWEDFGHPTLFWDFNRSRFSIATTNAMIEHVGRSRENPPCWERLPERERVRLRTRSQRELGAIMRRSFPTRAVWSATGVPVTVLGLMRDKTSYQRLVPDSPRDANWLLVEWTSGERTVVPATGLEDEQGRPWRTSLPRHCRGHGAFEARQNPDEGLRELERRVAEGDLSAMLSLYRARLRSGLFATTGGAGLEFESIERMLEAGVIAPDEAIDMHADRVRAYRQTMRELWLVHRLGDQQGLACPAGHLTAMHVARRMRAVEIVPESALHEMKQIADRLGALTVNVVAQTGAVAIVAVLSAATPIAAPAWLIFPAWSEERRPTLYWDASRRVFGIATREDLEEAAAMVASGVFPWSVNVPGEEADWK